MCEEEYVGAPVPGDVQTRGAQCRSGFAAWRRGLSVSGSVDLGCQKSGTQSKKIVNFGAWIGGSVCKGE